MTTQTGRPGADEVAGVGAGIIDRVGGEGSEPQAAGVAPLDCLPVGGEFTYRAKLWNTMLTPGFNPVRILPR